MTNLLSQKDTGVSLKEHLWPDLASLGQSGQVFMNRTESDMGPEGCVGESGAETYWQKFIFFGCETSVPQQRIELGPQR